MRLKAVWQLRVDIEVGGRLAVYFLVDIVVGGRLAVLS
jgi:hypothetical protein